MFFDNIAEKAGSMIASSGYALVTGGLGGVMSSAAKGAKSSAGLVVGVLPGYEKGSANKFVDIILPTGIGYARNVVVVSAGDLVVSIGGGYGTITEVAYSFKIERKLISFRSPVEHSMNFSREEKFFKELESGLDLL